MAYTQRKREQVTASNLAQQSFETYLPFSKTFKKSLTGLVLTSEPMFPRDEFFRPSLTGQFISGARSIRGVAFVLSFDFNPAVAKSEILNAIKACEIRLIWVNQSLLT